MNTTTLNQTEARAESSRAIAAAQSIHGLDLAGLTVATTLIPVSLIWDFSWESTIGVDRFWSPPHIANHLGVWLSTLLGLRLIFAATMVQRRSGAAVGVDVLGVRGPAGAWVLLWGGGVMLAAFLLDAWWQKAYGLGAGIWPPSQLLKTVGFFALLLGGLMVSVMATRNGSLGRLTASALVSWQGGLVLTMAAVVLSTRHYPNWQHGAMFYVLSAAVFPALLLLGRSTQLRWGATGVALTYFVVWGMLVWVLPLFPGRPLTPPIHNPTEHMLPPPFPLLLVIPALAIDLVRAWLVSAQMGWRKFALIGLLGVGFAAVFIPAQWFFADFLLSATADNWLFSGGGKHWPFFLKIDQARTLFWDANSNPVTWKTILLASGLATASAWIGFTVGGWLNRLRR